ncbi:hypothetical protein BMS3Bbin08_02276 [bacterium BMS3Bbin08]|nr:hypothetical protein BMS3Bbin08_02276 [bacterium BMS3Bbin08]
MIDTKTKKTENLRIPFAGPKARRRHPSADFEQIRELNSLAPVKKVNPTPSGLSPEKAVKLC